MLEQLQQERLNELMKIIPDKAKIQKLNQAIDEV